MQDYVLKIYYNNYLRDVRNNSESTIRHYQEALRFISKFLVEREKIQDSIYEVKDIDELLVLKEYLFNHPDFIAVNSRGHQMYSAGLNNYLRFAQGEGFESVNNKKLEFFDIEMPAHKEKMVKRLATYVRSPILKKQVIEIADYKCELNASHTTFIAKSNNKPYMEGHHALPISLQEHFDNSLDVYANIVCLCPVCHRMLHYGLDTEKKDAVDKVYYSRKDRLAKSGILLSRDEFEQYAL